MINILHLTYAQDNYLKKIYASRGIILAHERNGKVEFEIHVAYSPETIRLLVQSFYGICLYDKQVKMWVIPAAWFTKGRIKDFAKRVGIAWEHYAYEEWKELPDNMPEPGKEQEEYLKRHVLSPSDWQRGRV